MLGRYLSRFRSNLHCFNYDGGSIPRYVESASTAVMAHATAVRPPRARRVRARSRNATRVPLRREEVSLIVSSLHERFF